MDASRAASRGYCSGPDQKKYIAPARLKIESLIKATTQPTIWVERHTCTFCVLAYLCRRSRDRPKSRNREPAPWGARRRGTTVSNARPAPARRTPSRSHGPSNSSPSRKRKIGCADDRFDAEPLLEAVGPPKRWRENPGASHRLTSSSLTVAEQLHQPVGALA